MDQLNELLKRRDQLSFTLLEAQGEDYRETLMELEEVENEIQTLTESREQEL